MKRRKKPVKTGKSRHHIIPRSRGGNWASNNIAEISREKHEKYHILFDNMTPEEIIKHLVNVYWNKQWKWVNLAIKGGQDETTG